MNSVLTENNDRLTIESHSSEEKHT